MKRSLFFSEACALMFILVGFQKLAAQNTSPFWSLQGNSNASNSTSILGTTNAVNLGLFTKNRERVHINASNGYVGIGTKEPTSQLQVASKFITAIYGSSRGANSVGVGGYGNIGVQGRGGTYGVHGYGEIYGVYGYGIRYGVYGIGASRGVWGSGPTGVYGVTYTTTGIGIYGIGGTSSPGKGVYGTGYYGLYGQGGTYGVYGAGTTYGLYGSGRTYGVYAHGTTGVYGNGGPTGVYGHGSDYGVYGTGPRYGVYGKGHDLFDINPIGVYGEGGYGVYGNGYFYGIYGINSAGGGYAGYFGGDVYCSGSYIGSDKKLKQNITDMTNGMDIINKLQPKYYEYRQDGNFKLMNLPQGKQFGLIAQDVEQVLPNLIKETEFNVTNALRDKAAASEDSSPDKEKSDVALTAPVKKGQVEIVHFKALNYTELIPIIIKGMQELNKKTDEIDLLKKSNDDLRKEVEELKALVTKNNLTGNGYSLDAASLDQNTPNPFNSGTAIRYHLPQSTGSAKIIITDESGRTMKTMALTSRGEGVINLNSGTLAAGNYNYTLWVDGKMVDSKKMIITR